MFLAPPPRKCRPPVTRSERPARPSPWSTEVATARHSARLAEIAREIPCATSKHYLR